MRRICSLLLVALLLAPVAPAAAESLNEVVAALEAPFKAGAGRNTAINDMQADFAQESHLTSLDRLQRGRGQVAMQFGRPAADRLPAKFRWEYVQPTEQLIISDGQTMWVYVPENRQVIRSDIDPTRSRADDPMLFLTGLGDLSRDFLISWAEPSRDAAGNYILELRPRRPSPLIARLFVVVDRAAIAKGGKAFPIVSTNVIDPAGNSTRIEFKNVRVNRGLAAELFRFTPPAGVEVVRPTADGSAF